MRTRTRFELQNYKKESIHQPKSVYFIPNLFRTQQSLKTVVTVRQSTLRSKEELHISFIFLNFENPIITKYKPQQNMKKAFIPLALILTGALCASAVEAVATPTDEISRVVNVSNILVTKQPEKAAIDSLIQDLPTLTLNDAIAAIDSSMSENEITRIVDAVYLVNNLKNGYTLDTSRDAITFTSRFPFRRPNHLDIAKLKDIFNSESPILHKNYLKKFEFMFRNCGAMPELIGLRELIEKNVADCSEKSSALQQIDAYTPLMSGSSAPDAEFVDKDGRQHRLSDYAGKTVVIDVWATWCHNCLKKMPVFIDLRDSYAENDKIVFLTISIDRPDKRDLWDKVCEKHSLHGINNFITDSNDMSKFESDYKIYSIPRYIVINQNGKFVEAFAPSPGPELKKLIDTTL